MNLRLQAAVDFAGGLAIGAGLALTGAALLYLLERLRGKSEESLTSRFLTFFLAWVVFCMPAGYGNEWAVVLWGAPGVGAGWKHSLALTLLYTVPALTAGALYWRHAGKRKP